jgi:hypothetical protein
MAHAKNAMELTSLCSGLTQQDVNKKLKDGLTF